MRPRKLHRAKSSRLKDWAKGRMPQHEHTMKQRTREVVPSLVGQLKVEPDLEYVHA